MISERQQQFRVGLFVVAAIMIAGAMIFIFGEFRSVWDRHYTIAVHFEKAPGIYASSPVEMNGVVIGSVRKVDFDSKQGGVIVLIDVREKFQLRSDSRPKLMRSLLGDSTIDFVPGVSPNIIPPGTMLEGDAAVDPLEIAQKIGKKVTSALESFETTSREWRRVATHLNGIVDTQHGNLDVVIEQTAQALQQFTLTMQSANQTFANANNVFGNSKQQDSLRQTLLALPDMVAETRQTIAAVRKVVVAVDANMNNLASVTAPLAKYSQSIVMKLDHGLGNLESLTFKLNQFARMASKQDGSLRRFVSDPELYVNLNRSAVSLAVLLKNLEPVVKDLRLFSDRIARHPELLGVSGAMKGSSGLKDSEEGQPRHQSSLPRRNAVRR